ncbi:uncharacterized protein LOC114190126 [Vigna unguiculata]|uniref:uncharacterized protein LOC114190126 n=1 Tax=Vigna unguiculata TaxID=3917 RepID=UPI00101647BE|nr:uncharacterized protein LOC114190126 [Vigna unguiculata]
MEASERMTLIRFTSVSTVISLIKIDRNHEEKPCTPKINMPNGSNVDTEMQVLAVIGFHENIGRYYSSWIENEHLHIQMELCDQMKTVRTINITSELSGSIFGETIEDAIADFVVDEEVVIFEEKDFLEYLTNTNK